MGHGTSVARTPEAIVPAMARSAPTATPISVRSTISCHASVAKNCSADSTTKHARSAMYTFCLPNLSVTAPKMRPPKSMPTNEAAPRSPASTAVNEKATVRSGSATPMMLRM